MPRKPPVLRRTISKTLQQRQGWISTSKIDGYVLVRPQQGEITPEFVAQVRAHLETICVNANINRYTDSGGTPWIRIKNSDMVAEDDRGRHH